MKSSAYLSIIGGLIIVLRHHGKQDDINRKRISGDLKSTDFTVDGTHQRPSSAPSCIDGIDWFPQRLESSPSLTDIVNLPLVVMVTSSQQPARSKYSNIKRKGFAYATIPALSETA